MEDLLKKIMLLALTMFILSLFFGKYYVGEVKKIRRDLGDRKIEVPE